MPTTAKSLPPTTMNFLPVAGTLEFITYWSAQKAYAQRDIAVARAKSNQRELTLGFQDLCLANRRLAEVGL